MKLAILRPGRVQVTHCVELFDQRRNYFQTIDLDPGFLFAESMKASDIELIRRLKRENRQYRKENERHEKRIAELDGQLGQERKLWSSPESGDRFSDTREAHFVHKREMLDDIIANQHKLHPVS